MIYLISEDDFGEVLPNNWFEACRVMNGKIRELCDLIKTHMDEEGCVSLEINDLPEEYRKIMTDPSKKGSYLQDYLEGCMMGRPEECRLSASNFAWQAYSDGLYDAEITAIK